METPFNSRRGLKGLAPMALAVLCAGIGILAGWVLVQSSLGLIGTFLVNPSGVSAEHAGLTAISGVCLLAAIRGIKAAQRLMNQEDSESS